MKYAIFLAYNGAKFKGMQCTVPFDNTVESFVKKALLSLSPLYQPEIAISSRTDKGVHCYRKCLKINITLPLLNYRICKKEYLKASMNDYFHSFGLDISVLEVCIPNTDHFNPRFFALRSYLYRFAVVKDDLETNMPYPIFSNIFLVKGDFNVEIAKSVCKLFLGVHDFSNFYTFRFDNIRSTVRDVIECSITQGTPPPYASLYDPDGNIKYYDINVTSTGFLYHMVRIMVGNIIHAGLKKRRIHDIKKYLEDPLNNICKHRICSPACGLTLTKSNYPSELFTESIKCCIKQSEIHQPSHLFEVFNEYLKYLKQQALLT